MYELRCDEWQQTAEAKLKVHGPYRVLVGGPTPPTAGEPSAQGAKHELVSDTEPVCWHVRPVKVYDALIHRYCCTRTFDCLLGEADRCMPSQNGQTSVICHPFSNSHTRYCLNNAIINLVWVDTVCPHCRTTDVMNMF